MSWVSRVGKLLVVLLALPLMGQTQNCNNIDSVVKDLLDSKFKPGGGQSKIYISNLSFVDSLTRTTMIAGEAELINKAVEDGMNTLANQDPKYAVNQSGKSIINNDANANKLVTIFFDQNMTKAQRIDKIISELMEPNGVDGLVAGQYTDDPNTQTITVRPFVISKASRALATDSKSFKPGEYKCTDPQNPGKTVMCTKAHEEVRDIVIKLLKQL